MTWWEKAKEWSLVHWRWLVFSVAALIAFILGSSKAREWKRSAKLAKKNYKKEKEVLEDIRKRHVDSAIKAHEDHERAHEANVLSFKEKSEQLRRERIRKMLEDSKSDPEAINKYLKEKGIEEE